MGSLAFTRAPVLRFCRVIVVLHKTCFLGHLDLSRAADHLVELSWLWIVHPKHRRKVSWINCGSAWSFHCFFFSYRPPPQNPLRRWKARCAGEIVWTTALFSQ